MYFAQLIMVYSYILQYLSPKLSKLSQRNYLSILRNKLYLFNYYLGKWKFFGVNG